MLFQRGPQQCLTLLYDFEFFGLTELINIVQALQTIDMIGTHNVFQLMI